MRYKRSSEGACILQPVTEASSIICLPASHGYGTEHDRSADKMGCCHYSSLKHASRHNRLQTHMLGTVPPECSVPLEQQGSVARNR
jgi:hypothetical protein